MNGYLPGTDPTLIRPGLSRCLALLNRLDNPHLQLRYVHITGTNGKGSTAACVASILGCCGYRTGLFTSPALEHFSQRIQVDGVPIPTDTLNTLQTRVTAAAALMEDPPTEFELVTALALLHFAQEACDLVVLEVGMGGAEDATNVIPAPEVAVFTAMGMDHMGFLGDTQEKIATAKAGILKPGCHAVSYGNLPECNRIFRQTCDALSVPLTRVDFSRIRELTCTLEGSRFRVEPYGPLRLPLLGQYQVKNALTAITVAEQLSHRGWVIPGEAIRQGLSRVEWPGRMEVLHPSPLFLLDGSHNPQGLQATVRALQDLLPQKPVILMGVMADKDVPGMIRLLSPLACDFVTVTPSNPRAMPAPQLAGLIREMGLSAVSCPSIPQGVSTALELAGKSGCVCALGTLYFSSEVRKAAKAILGI